MSAKGLPQQEASIGTGQESQPPNDQQSDAYALIRVGLSRQARTNANEDEAANQQRHRGDNGSFLRHATSVAGVTRRTPASARGVAVPSS